MVPAEDPKVEHIGTKQCVVDWLYIESMFFKSSGRSLDGVLRYLLNPLPHIPKVPIALSPVSKSLLDHFLDTQT